MAVDVYQENFVGITSPRLSFSHDLEEEDEAPNITYRLDHTLADSATPFDFAFNVDSSIGFKSSTADELFSDGKILPTDIMNKEQEHTKSTQESTKELMPCLETQNKKSLKEFLQEEEDEEEPNTTARSFWKFRRSNSLNCDRNQRKGFMGSWKVLSRSGSTGRYLERIVEEEAKEKPNTNLKSFWKFKRSSSLSSDTNVGVNGNNTGLVGSSKILRKSHSTKDYDLCSKESNSKPFRRSSSLNCDTRRGANHQGLNGSGNVLPRSYSTGSALKKQQKFVANDANSGQKRQGKNNSKVHGFGYGNYSSNNNVMRVSPVLNLPSPYISRVSVDLFSFGSLFCNGNTKDRRKKR